MGRTGAGMAIGRTLARAGFPRTMLAVAVAVGMTRTTLGAVRTAVAVARGLGLEVTAPLVLHDKPKKKYGV